jgi:hypothetical protein
LSVGIITLTIFIVALYLKGIAVTLLFS